MSEKKTKPAEKKKQPYSVYLSPKADSILRELEAFSQFGSYSRTIEEIILAYNDVYDLIQSITPDQLLRQPQGQDRDFVSIIVSVPFFLAIKQAIARLHKAPDVREKIEKIKQIEELEARLKKMSPLPT